MALDPRPAVTIPNSDHLLLESIAEEAASDRHPIASYLLGELRRAAILPDHELPAGTVTLNRWVTYRIDQGWPLESRVLVCPEDYRLPNLHLSVLSPLGAALLGLRVGSRIRYWSIEGVPMSRAWKASARRPARSRSLRGQDAEPLPTMTTLHSIRRRLRRKCNDRK